MNTTNIEVALVDDEPTVLRALELVLSALGCGVTGFSDPRSALAYLKSGAPCDVLVSDLRMPHMSGTELIISIKSFRKLPSILISGHAGELDSQLALGSGVDRVLRKPFSPSELLKLISELSGQRQACPSSIQRM